MDAAVEVSCDPALTEVQRVFAFWHRPDRGNDAARTKEVDVCLLDGRVDSVEDHFNRRRRNDFLQSTGKIRFAVNEVSGADPLQVVRVVGGGCGDDGAESKVRCNLNGCSETLDGRRGAG